jgi:hypothetical protein
MKAIGALIVLSAYIMIDIVVGIAVNAILISFVDIAPIWYIILVIAILDISTLIGLHSYIIDFINSF